MRALLLTFLLGCGGWGKADTILELTGQAANAYDWRQSEKITQAGLETNAILGPHGDRVPLDAYCGSVMILHFLVSAALPRGPWRTAWQGLSAGLELHVVYNNWLWGYR